MNRFHINYYFLETLILGLGFFVVYMLETFMSQVIGLSFVLFLYVCMGFFHHYLQHDIHLKIVLEYIIISILVISLFIFLKSGVI